MKNRNLRVIIIIAILASVIGLSIGFAALGTTLTINTKTTMKGSTWSVKFINLETPSLTGSAEVMNPATITDTVITIDVSVTKPGDVVAYTFDVTNDGTIDAKLSSIPTYTGKSEAEAKNIIYSLTYADDTPLAADDSLNAGDTKNLKLTVTFDALAEEVPEEDQVVNISAVLIYVQK